jgi:hypothetical protein
MTSEYAASKRSDFDPPLTEDEYREIVYHVLVKTSATCQVEDKENLRSTTEEKFVAKPSEFVCGEYQHAAKGFYKLLNVQEEEIMKRASEGVGAIEKEVQALGDVSVAEQLDYILWQKAQEKQFSNGVRDKDHAGMQLEDFVNHVHSKTAELQEAEVVALRLYTTSAFKQINKPLRDQDRINNGTAHPLPVTVTLISRGIKKLRVIDAENEEAVKSMVLWRGMCNVRPSDNFAVKGGTELAPMSTTKDIQTAVAYSVTRESGASESEFEALIFKIITKNGLQRGADLQWLSAFPAEAEILYPPITYLQPTGRTQVIEKINNCSVRIVEAIPTLA